jgi:hypothetical protein
MALRKGFIIFTPIPTELRQQELQSRLMSSLRDEVIEQQWDWFQSPDEALSPLYKQQMIYHLFSVSDRNDTRIGIECEAQTHLETFPPF